MRNVSVPKNPAQMDPATIIGATSAILSFVHFAGKIIKTGVELHSTKAHATEINKTFEESVTEFETRIALLKTRTSHARNNNSYNNSPTADDAWNNLLNCSRGCENLGERLLVLLGKCKANNKNSRPSFSERLGLFATHKTNVSKPAGCRITEVIRASVITVWTSGEIESLRDQWSQCITAFNAACTRYESFIAPEICKYCYSGIHMKIRFESCQHFDCLVEIYQRHSSQLEGVQSLIQSLVDQSQDLNLRLLDLCNDYQRANSTSARQAKNQDWILKAISFPQSRKEQIQGDIGKTFHWITSHEPFIQWLNSTDDIYHISGKPGSGKSTMMKFIDGNTDVHKRLDQWAQLDNKALLKASFYAWKPTSDAFEWKPEDHSCTELLIRSLLHQLLTSAPKYIQTVFSQHWNPETFTVFNTKTQTENSEPRLSFYELQTALHELLDKHLTQSYRIFFLIDAMDEFGHAYAHELLAKTVQRWCQCSPQNIKICVSSREDNPFLNAFPAQQRLQLHLHTNHDIKELVKTRLKSNPHFQSDKFKEEDRKELIRAIVDNAKGVFVWVVFTINELLLLLADRPDFVTLKEMVDTFRGQELNDFLREIFNRIPSTYHQEARAVFSVVGIISADRIQNHFCLQHYSEIAKCLTTSETWSQSNPCQNLPQQAAHDVRQFKSRLPTISRGMLELDYFDNACKGSVSMVQESNAGLRFIHRSVYDFFKENPDALMNNRHEELTIDSLSLILRSSIRVLGMVTPLDTYEQRSILQGLISGLLRIVGNEGRDSTGDIRFSYASSLRELDIALFHLFGALPSDKDFESCTESDLKLRPAFPSVFQESICSENTGYGIWALNGNYPAWVHSDSVKDYVSEMIFKDHEVGQLDSTHGLLYAVHSGYLDLDEPSRYIPPPRGVSPQIRGSLWLNYCIQGLMSERIDRPSWAMLISECHPRPRINFRWWSEGDAHQQDVKDVPRGKDYQPWIMPGKDLDAIDLGKRFGVIVTVGDDREGQLIQGPQWSNDIHFTRIIRLLILNFGTASGEASVRDIVAKLLTLEEDDRIGIKSESRDLSAEINRKNRLQMVDDVLQKLDEAPGGKESSARLRTPDEELKGEGGNGDVTFGGLPTKEERFWESGAARSSQHARSLESAWIWTNFKHLVVCGLGKSIYTSTYEKSCYIANIVYLFSGCANCSFPCYRLLYASGLILMLGHIRACFGQREVKTGVVSRQIT